MGGLIQPMQASVTLAHARKREYVCEERAPSRGRLTMPRGIDKADLPTKTCPICARPFSWRRKWAAVWSEVIYCSEKCRRNKKRKA